MKLVVGILLAAGSSRRFGTDKLKYALPDGDLVAVRSCRNLLRGTDTVIAVVRPSNEGLAAYLAAEGADVKICMAAAEGMGTSLAFAVRQAPEAIGWVVALADMPWILPATIREVSAAIHSGAKIAAPSWQGQRGHPVGFAHRLGQELTLLQGDVGAKTIIQANRHQLRLLDCQDPGVLRDIDKPTDLLSQTTSAKPT